MDTTMISYTTEDIKILADCSSGELAALLEDIDYDPKQFEEMMKGLPKDYHFLYKIPYEDLPEYIDDPRFAGYLIFRLKAGK